MKIQHPLPLPAGLTQEDIGAAIDWALYSRRSARAFLARPVERATLEAVLQAAARAPSGTNTQPWQVHVLTGDALKRLSDAIVTAYDDPEVAATHQEDYAYYPREWVSPYIDRRRKVGWDLYGLLNIAKTDRARMHDQHRRNYLFFDAPVGLIFTIDRVMAQGSWLDYGMFLQSIMIAARGHGLDTCPQAAFTQFHQIIENALKLTPAQQVVCGMALGYIDDSRVENSLVTERAPVGEFTRFLED